MIYLSKKIDLEIPILLVDFSKDEILDVPEAQDVISNLEELNTKIYTTQNGNPVYPGINLPYWFTDFDNFSKFLPETIQICGLYKELCLYQLASFLASEKTPIIIDNDKYSVGASEETISETPWISFEERIKQGKLQYKTSESFGSPEVIYKGEIRCI